LSDEKDRWSKGASEIAE